MSFPCVPGYSHLSVCGRGAFGVVYSATHDHTGEKVALKVFNRDSIDPASAELDIHRDLFHPFIVQYFSSVIDAGCVSIALEFIEGESLLTYINRHGRIAEETAQRIFCQIVSAVDYLHGARIVHRDLKLENLLITQDLTVKLIDFGFAYRNAGPQTGQCMTYPYAAPEILSKTPYTEAIDIWSLGVILYALVCGCLPFGDGPLGEVCYKICYQDCAYPSSLSDEVCDLLQAMLQKDPASRVTIRDVRSHPWLSKSDSASVVSDDFVKQLETAADAAPDAIPPVAVAGPGARLHHSTGTSVAEDSDWAMMFRFSRWKRLQKELVRYSRPIRHVESEAGEKSAGGASPPRAVSRQRSLPKAALVPRPAEATRGPPRRVPVCVPRKAWRGRSHSDMASVTQGY
jgi:5'-AMP-activated protein kinase catalytic alpha subunit